MKYQTDESNDESPWRLLAVAAFMFAGAWYMHSVLTGLEHSGGTMRINVVFVALYNAFGKWGVVGTCAGLGAFALFLAMRKFLKS
jgi:hypothetical protein